MTLSEIQTFVNARYKESTTELNTLITALANEAIIYYARKARFPQLEVLGSSFTTTAGTEAYSLPTNFDRMIDNSVRYDVTTYSNGSVLPQVFDTELEYFRGLSEGSRPLCCAIGAPTSGTTFNLLLYPAFTETSKTVEYDYVKKPTTLSASSDSVQVPALDYAICYYVLKGIADYHDDEKRAAQYAREERHHWLMATKTASPGF